MNAAQLQSYLHERIPLSRAMAVEVVSATRDGVRLRAPLAPNINHRDTVFGGSASALAILAAWSAVQVRMLDEGLSGRIVIRRNTMSYDRPVTGSFAASASVPDGPQWQKLVAAVARRRPARLRLASVLESEGQPVGSLEGEFVVLPP